jgi:hypothetical protein
MKVLPGSNNRSRELKIAAPIWDKLRAAVKTIGGSPA